MMLIKGKDYIIITLLTVLSTLILWSPFLLKLKSINGQPVKNPTFQTVIANYDGPFYIIVAKTLYNKNDPLLVNSPLGLSPSYFAAHLPLYPIIIRIFSSIFTYPRAMLLTTLLTSIGLFSFFYYFVKKLKLTNQPLWLTIVFMFITPRFLAIRSVGTPEPLFLLLILVSMFFFMEKRFLFAGLFGALATMTKTPGILLFGAYALFFIEEWYKNKTISMKWFYIFLIPLGLVSVFYLYSIQLQDFFAFFHTGGVVPILFPPFSVFNYQAKWVQSGWLEDIVLLYFFYIGATINLFSHKILKPVFYFMIAFSFAIICVEHRDISRYALPILPFALISFEKIFTTKKFLICLLILLPAIYLYSWNFMLNNVSPITDWKPFI